MKIIILHSPGASQKPAPAHRDTNAGIWYHTGSTSSGPHFPVENNDVYRESEEPEVPQTKQPGK